MSSPNPSQAMRSARGFRRNQRGSAAVEFALIAPIFFALLFAIIETGLMFFASQLLETATQDTARLVMTGQAQGANYTQEQFKQEICNRVSPMFDCLNGIYVDVQNYPAFSNVKITDPIDGGGNFVPVSQYKPGGPGDIVVVRIYYEWPMLVAGLGYSFANLANHNELLIATAAFKNEPFPTGS